jgi:hypothetical protein
VSHTNVGLVGLSVIQAARDIMAAEVRTGQLCLSCDIEVVDAEGCQVLKLHSKDTIGLIGL